MAEIWILRGKHENFSLRLSYHDELQELQLGHVGKVIFKIFSPFFKNKAECFSQICSHFHENY